MAILQGVSGEVAPAQSRKMFKFQKLLSEIRNGISLQVNDVHKLDAACR
jgi:hypothetical protein